MERDYTKKWGLDKIVSMEKFIASFSRQFNGFNSIVHDFTHSVDGIFLRGYDEIKEENVQLRLQRFANANGYCVEYYDEDSYRWVYVGRFIP